MHRIIYVSTAIAGIDEEEVKAIEAVAQKNNLTHGITGLLVYNGANFLQIIEGPKPALVELMKKIRDDGRHTGLSILADEPTDHRAFPEWSMKVRYYAPGNAVDAAISSKLPPAHAAILRNFAKLKS